jgi:hypothetical protein
MSTPVYSTEIIEGAEVVIIVETDTISHASSPFTNLRDGNESKVVEKTERLLEQGMSLAKNSATLMVKKIDEMGEAIRPDEFELQFAIKLDAEIGAVLAKTSTEAQLQVKMTWKRKETT